MSKAAKQRLKKTAWSAFGILNHYGEPWTPRTFDDEADAKAYMRDWSKAAKIAIPNHRVVKVRVTITTTN